MKTRHDSILCIGECMTEMAPNEAGNYRMGYAGDTFNTAWYLKGELPSEWCVSYLTALGDDATSDQMIDFIGRSGVSTKYITRLADKTAGLYMIHLNDGERSFSYWRDNSAARELAADARKLEVAMRSVGIIYLSGITVAILRDAGRENLLLALNNARKNGAIIVFDPNLRPRLWENKEVMRDEIMRIAAISDIVLPSFDDEKTYFGDSSPAITFERYLRSGAKLVVLKNGSGDISAVGSEIDSASYSPIVLKNPVDTTAAGDSFNAGFLVDYLANDEVASALKAGADLSRRVIGQRGALVQSPAK